MATRTMAKLTITHKEEIERMARDLRVAWRNSERTGGMYTVLLVDSAGRRVEIDVRAPMFTGLEDRHGRR